MTRAAPDQKQKAPILPESTSLAHAGACGDRAKASGLGLALVMVSSSFVESVDFTGPQASPCYATSLLPGDSDCHYMNPVPEMLVLGALTTSVWYSGTMHN